MVGIGPGDPADRTRRAVEAIRASSIVVGYTRYLEMITDLTPGKTLISTGMRGEVRRCEKALDMAAEGNIVSLVSSGDPGIYGMAGLALEMKTSRNYGVDIEIVPGVTAASAAAASLGSPLMIDFAVISLSDILVPWEQIEIRLDAVAAADLVTVLYNPKSRSRPLLIEAAREIFRRHRPGETLVGVVTDAGTEKQEMALSTLAEFLNLEINMRSVVIIGNASSYISHGRFITPRGYAL